MALTDGPKDYNNGYRTARWLGVTSNALLVFAALPVVFFFVIFISSLAASGGSILAPSNALFSGLLLVVYGLGLFVVSLMLRGLSHLLAGVLDIASKS
jgi:hypothetical protein